MTGDYWDTLGLLSSAKGVMLDRYDPNHPDAPDESDDVAPVPEAGDEADRGGDEEAPIGEGDDDEEMAEVKISR